MADSNIKRVGLYFNLDNPIEKNMWDYLESKGKKSYIIKRLIEDEVNGYKSTTNSNMYEEIKESKVKLDINKEDLEGSMEGMNF